jgi:hypothetical protein
VAVGGRKVSVCVWATAAVPIIAASNVSCIRAAGIGTGVGAFAVNGEAHAMTKPSKTSHPKIFFEVLASIVSPAMIIKLAP